MSSLAHLGCPISESVVALASFSSSMTVHVLSPEDPGSFQEMATALHIFLEDILELFRNLLEILQQSGPVRMALPFNENIWSLHELAHAHWLPATSSLSPPSPPPPTKKWGIYMISPSKYEFYTLILFLPLWGW